MRRHLCRAGRGPSNSARKLICQQPRALYILGDAQACKWLIRGVAKAGAVQGRMRWGLEHTCVADDILLGNAAQW